MLLNGIFLLIALALCFFAYKKYFSVIDLMTKELLSVNENLGKINADDYANNFNDIDKVMKNNNSVKNIWLDFCSSLTTASLEDDKKRRYAITSAGEFFRFSTITQSINVAYWKNFGGIFTGIGIFGTFLGLTIGLLGVDLATSDTAALKEGIGNLLSGISVAFGTSLIGIFCALLYGGFYKYYTDKFNSVIDDLVFCMEKFFPRMTAEQWLAKNLHESREQTKSLKNLSQDMAQSLEGQLSDRFNELCDKLSGEMQPVFEKLCEAIENLNSSGVSALSDVISSKTESQLDYFVEVLKNISTTMETNVANSARTTEQANSMLLATVNELKQSVIDGTEDAVKKQKAASESMAVQIRDIVSMLQNSSTDAMNNFVQRSNEMHGRLTQSLDNAKDTTEVIIKNMQEMSQKQEECLQRSLNSMTDKMKSFTDNLYAVLEKHKNSVENLYAKINGVAESVKELSKGLDESSITFKSTVEPVKSAINTLKEETQKMMVESKKVQKIIAEQIHSLENSGQITSDNLKNLTEINKESAQKISESWSRYSDNFDNIGGEIKAATEDISKRLSEYNGVMNSGMKENLKDFSDNVITIIREMNVITDELCDIVSDLKEVKN